MKKRLSLISSLPAALIALIGLCGTAGAETAAMGGMGGNISIIGNSAGFKGRLMDERTGEELPLEAHDTKYPNWGIDPEPMPARPVQVAPNNGAIFREDSVVTLTWWPYHLDRVPAIRYEVMVSSPFIGYYKIISQGQYRPGKPGFILYQPPGPGMYFWQVWAYMDDGGLASSTGRTFWVFTDRRD